MVSMVFYPVLGILFIIFGIIIAIWFIVHIEKGFTFSGLKSGIAIALLASFFAFGIQFLLIALGSVG